MILTFEGVALL